MGVNFPTTKSTAETTDNYYMSIAREIGNMLLGKRTIVFAQFNFPLRFLLDSSLSYTYGSSCSNMYRRSLPVKTWWDDHFDRTVLCI